MKYIISLHSLHTWSDICSCISLWMTCVKTYSWWIRKHIKCIVLWLWKVPYICFKCSVFFPILLPLWLDRLGIISCCISHLKTSFLHRLYQSGAFNHIFTHFQILSQWKYLSITGHFFTEILWHWHYIFVFLSFFSFPFSFCGMEKISPAQSENL